MNKLQARLRKFQRLKVQAGEFGYDLLPKKEGVGRGYQLESLRRDVEESKRGNDHVTVWNEFWKEICERADGTLDLDAIQRELSDFYTLLSFVPRVYDHVTGGMATKPMTWPTVIMGLADDHVNKHCDSAVEDFQQSERAIWFNDDYKVLGTVSDEQIEQILVDALADVRKRSGLNRSENWSEIHDGPKDDIGSTEEAGLPADDKPAG